MPDFRYQDGEFYCEAVPLCKIAEAVGTPCYVYSHATLVRQFRSFDSAFSEVPHLSPTRSRRTPIWPCCGC